MIPLNTEQAKTVLSPAKRKLVCAGPGSGKTRTLCAAVADAVRRGHKPEAIVAITYTNAAASEVETRLRQEFGLADRLGFVGTLHAFCLSLVREHPEALGLPAAVSVVDDGQRDGLLDSVREEMGVKCSARKAQEILAACRGADPGGIPTKETLLVKEYHRRLSLAGLLDFDMVLAYGLALVRRIGEHVWPYECLFWDEAQDCSDGDFDFLAACPCEEKFVVGDSDQAIFGFRGGNVGRFVLLCKEPDWAVFLLEANHRSGSRLCDHAQELVARNLTRVKKWTRAVRSGGTVVAHRCETPADELGYVLQQIKDMVHCACEDEPWDMANQRMAEVYSDVAVLARTNRLADAFASHLSANGVPVRRAKSQPEPADWRRAKLLLTVLDNPWNDYAVAQFLRADRPDDWKSVQRMAAGSMVGLNEFLGWPFGKGGGVDLDVDLARNGVGAESRDRIVQASRELVRLRGSATVLEILLYLNAMEDARREEGEGVTCATMHGSKGREWKHVFVVGCEEGAVPSGKAKLPAEVEEERRLFYVAMTRAAETLTLTWCAARPQWRGDKMPPGPMEPKAASRFLAEAGL